MSRGTNRATLMQFLYFFAFGSAVNYFTLYYKNLLVGANGEPLYEVIGLIFLVQSLVAFTSPLIAGILADKYQITNRLITICSVGVALGAGMITLPGLAPLAGLTLTGKLFLVFPGAVMATFFIKPIVPLIDTGTLRTLEARDGHANRYGRIRMAGSTGWIIVNLLMGRWLDHSGRLVDAVVVYVICFAGLALISAGGFNTNVKKVDIDLSYLVRDKVLRALVALAFIRMFGFSMAFTYTGVFLSELNMSYTQMGMAFGLAALLEIPVFFKGENLLKKLGGKNLILIDISLQVIRLGIFYFFPHVTNMLFYVAIQMLMGLGYCLYLMGIIHILNTIAPASLKASYQNIFYVFTAMANIFTGFTASFIVRAWGTRTLMGICCLILFLAFNFTALRLPVSRKSHPA